MRKFLPWIVLGLVVLATLAWAAWPRDASATGRVDSLASELRCPDCEQTSVADSQTSGARAVREDLARRVDRGESDAEIRAAYVMRYGENVLLKPDGSGLGALVWILPVIVLVVGVGGLALALARWRREPRLHATEADETMVESAREH